MSYKLKYISKGEDDGKSVGQVQPMLWQGALIPYGLTYMSKKSGRKSHSPVIKS